MLGTHPNRLTPTSVGSRGKEAVGAKHQIVLPTSADFCSHTPTSYTNLLAMTVGASHDPQIQYAFPPLAFTQQFIQENSAVSFCVRPKSAGVCVA